jgi:hypothetical protein
MLDWRRHSKFVIGVAVETDIWMCGWGGEEEPREALALCIVRGKERFKK